MAKIFIDAGHGGRDPGAVGSKSRESDNVLKVAKRLKTLLESYGHTVRLSRSTDKYLTLSERSRMANNWGADYFLSLHNNAFASKSATGFETFIYNGGVSSKTVEFQKAVHEAIAYEIGIKDRGKKKANFAVLRESKMTAILIEYAFITNEEDQKILMNKVNNLAKWTCEGIVDYVGGTVKAKSSKLSSKPKKTVSKPKTTSKSIAQMAQEIIDGKHGNGHENRRKSLGISKSEYEKVRAEVNRRAGIKTKSKPRKTISQMATEVIRGDHGQGHAQRRRSLGIDNATYQKVRAEVNRRLK